MASKIDYSEGSFMAELEGMESKRLEAATDFAGKLEDRYVVLQKWFTYKMTCFVFFLPSVFQRFVYKRPLQSYTFSMSFSIESVPCTNH